MTLIVTNTAELSKILEKAIADLKKAMPKIKPFSKSYGGIKDHHKRGKDTFKILASSSFRGVGCVSVIIALATPDSTDSARQDDNDAVKLAQDICLKAGGKLDTEFKGSSYRHKTWPYTRAVIAHWGH